MKKHENKEYKEKIDRFCDESLHEKIPEPQVKTEFDKEIKHLTEKV